MPARVYKPEFKLGCKVLVTSHHDSYAPLVVAIIAGTSPRSETGQKLISSQLLDA